MSMLYGDFVLPPLLASGADLDVWMNGAPDNAEQFLRQATQIVLDATNTAYYPTDPTTGLSTDARIAQALNDATCSQAAAISTLNIDPNAGGVVMPGVESSKRIGSAGITYADAGSASDARTSAATDLVPEARRILRLNNLLQSSAWWFG